MKKTVKNEKGSSYLLVHLSGMLSFHTENSTLGICPEVSDVSSVIMKSGVFVTS